MEHKGRPPVSVDESSRVSDPAANSTGHGSSQHTADKARFTTHPEQTPNKIELVEQTKTQMENETPLKKTESNSQNADVGSAHLQKPVLKRLVNNLASNFVKSFAQDSNKKVQVDPRERARQGTSKQASKRPNQVCYRLRSGTFSTEI
jgi:hypothetical protein